VALVTDRVQEAYGPVLAMAEAYAEKIDAAADRVLIGSRVLSARVHPTVAEQADAPLSNSGDESREGSTPSRGTHRHLPEVFGDAYYDKGQRMRRTRCRECGEELEARRG